MITLNLLPPLQKEKIKKMAIYSVIENLIAGLFVVLTIVAIILLVSRNILENKFASFSIANVNPPKEIEELNIKIRKLNSDLSTISKVQKGFKKWSSFLMDFNQLIPTDTQITYLNLIEDEKSIIFQVKGKTSNREQLLKFEKNLENSPLFTHVKSPLSNILQKEDIEFIFDLTLSN